MTVTQESTEGYAAVNGVEMYWRSVGTGGTPLIVVHGGFGTVDSVGDLAQALAEGRRVISVELQGHGHTADVDRPFSFEAFGDDLAGLVDRLDLGQADLLGYSLGAGAVVRAAVQHPDRFRRLVAVSTAARRDGYHPEVVVGMSQVGDGAVEMLRRSPAYDAYAAVAPDVDAFPRLVNKTGELLRQPHDWSDEIRRLQVPTLLVYADADSVPVTHMAEFFALLGGGLRDAGWDGSARPANRLAVLPGRTHYDILEAPELPGLVRSFLAG